MIEGTGIDIVEMPRITQVVQRQKRFPARILTAEETRLFQRLDTHRQLEFLAGHFAAKEACAKALGTGIGIFLSWHDIEMTADESGKPHMTVKSLKNRHVHVSVSHTRQYAVAQVIIERG